MVTCMVSLDAEFCDAQHVFFLKNRITPTVKMLQSKLRECQRFSEARRSHGTFVLPVAGYGI